MAILRKILPLLLCAGFLLGIHDGYIALWQGEDPQPVRIFPYRAELLPPADQQRLEKGIRVQTREDVTRLLEDFCS